MPGYGSVASTRYVEKQLTARQVATLDMLPKETRREIRKEARAIAERDTFGVDHRKDKDGPIEQGLGSPGNMTQQSLDAYIANQTDKRRRPDGPEKTFDANVERMKKMLAESEARRRAQRAAEDDDD